MARRRSFRPEAVVVSAQDVFWERGYQGTGITSLEQATGLRRSSIYHAFGNKEQLFQLALSHYEDTFLADLLGPLEAPEARPSEIERFFQRLATRFRGDPEVAQRGCLWVNAIAEGAERGLGL